MGTAQTYSRMRLRPREVRALLPQALGNLPPPPGTLPPANLVCSRCQPCPRALRAPGIRLAFLVAQPGQASKTVTAAFTRWPRALGGAAQAAPTRRFSPASHLRRELGGPVLSLPGGVLGVWGRGVPLAESGV